MGAAATAATRVGEQHLGVPFFFSPSKRQRSPDKQGTVGSQAFLFLAS